VDALYELAPDDFTAARNALVRALKAEDRRAEAAHVAKLRRPAVAAWAVNQAVRRHRDRFGALLDAGAEVQRTQRRALSGVRGSGLREATRARRQLIDELTGLALQALTERGANAETHRGDIAATFDSASADDDAAVTVTAARLTAPLPITSGFGSLDGFAVLPDDAGDADEEPAPEPSEDAGDGPEREQEAQRERAAQRRRQAMRAVQEAQRTVAEAEKAAKRAADAVVARGAAADQAERAAREAEQTWRRRQQEATDLRDRVAAEQRRAEQARAAVEEHTAVLREREQELQDLDG